MTGSWISLPYQYWTKFGLIKNWSEGHGGIFLQSEALSPLPLQELKQNKQNKNKTKTKQKEKQKEKQKQKQNKTKQNNNNKTKSIFDFFFYFAPSETYFAFSTPQHILLTVFLATWSLFKVKTESLLTLHQTETIYDKSIFFAILVGQWNSKQWEKFTKIHLHLFKI